VLLLFPIDYELEAPPPLCVCKVVITREKSLQRGYNYALLCGKRVEVKERSPTTVKRTERSSLQKKECQKKRKKKGNLSTPLIHYTRYI
jgi:hypothetical protein